MLCCALSWALPSPRDTLGNSSVSESGAFPGGQRSTVAETGGKQIHCHGASLPTQAFHGN